MLIISNLEDQLFSLSYLKAPEFLLNGYPYKNIFFWLLSPLYNTQPITVLAITLIRDIRWFNALIFLTILLCLFFSFKFFKRFKYAAFYSLIFVFSSYFWLHSGVHIDLSQLWLYPIFLIFLFRKGWRIFPMSVLLIFSVLISNYIGFFLLIYMSAYVVVELFLDFFTNNPINLSRLKSFLFIVLIVGSSSFLVLRNYTSYSSAFSMPTIVRSYEDFFTFSSRPWYFLIPSPKHPVYGEFATLTLETIKDTNYFLADDYFVGEHGASFFGYGLLLTFFVVSGYIVYKGSKEQKINLYRYWFINIGLFLLMLPPFFTISGFKIYTPGWLMYKFFPMFRTTVRMSVLMLMNILIVLASFFDDLAKKYPKKQLLIFSFVALLTGVTLFETFIPVKIQKLDNPPIVYSYIGEDYSGTNFVVYPYSATNEALFWVDAHKSYLLNPRMYKNGDFDSEIFTKELNTPLGLLELNNVSANYLVVFKNAASEDLQFFLSSNTLVLDKEFSDSYIFKVLSDKK